MPIQELIDEIKSRPGFEEQAGMILAHNGVVRAWSRDGRKKVLAVDVVPDEIKMGAICQELGSRPGIFAISAQANQGVLKPGDDLLYLVVAGDVRENVIDTFRELLDRVKKEAVRKKEILE